MNDLQILLTTILGALLVLVAVWQIVVRRNPDRNTAKFLGIEFDLSTPGLVVLAAGCTLLVLPAFLPYRPGGLPSFGGTAKDSGSAILRQETVLSGEQEPNDHVGSANRITLGQTITGTLEPSKGDIDYFILTPPKETRGTKRIIVRTQGDGCCVHLEVWNEKEEDIAHGHAIAGETISLSAPPADTYLIRISENVGGKRDITYEFVVQLDR